MIIESTEFRKEDGTRVVIILNISEYYEKTDKKILKKIRYQIHDIRYREPKKRIWKSFKLSFIDNFDYRQLDQEDRRKYEIEKYIEFVGKEQIEKTIMSTWEKLTQYMKPNINEILMV